MRTTIDIPDEQRAELLRMAGERGEKGFSKIVQQAIEEYLRGRKVAGDRTKAALAVLGTLSESSASRMEETVHEAPEHLAVIVADSDVLIDALRGRQPALDRIAVELRAGGLATTAITVFELLSGARTAAEERKVEQLLAALTVLGMDSAAATAAAEARRALEAEGQKIGMADYLIAGICIARSAVLLTNNRKHFERVPGLRLGGEPQRPR